MKREGDCPELRAVDKVLAIALVEALLLWLTDPRNDPCYLQFPSPGTSNVGTCFRTWVPKTLNPIPCPTQSRLLEPYWAQVSYKKPCSLVPQFTKSNCSLGPSKIISYSTPLVNHIESSVFLTWTALHTPLCPEMSRTTLGSPRCHRRMCGHRETFPTTAKQIFTPIPFRSRMLHWQKEEAYTILIYHVGMCFSANIYQYDK